MKLEMHDVSFSYRSKRGSRKKAFDALNLAVHSGECVGIIGNEGVGKTTLLQLMAGLLKPDNGAILVDGIDFHAKRSTAVPLRRHIGFSFQFPEQQFFCPTVKEELLYSSVNQKVAASLSPMEALRLLGVEDVSYLDRSPFSLSMGEARRVALATLLMLNPEILLLDEPTAGLDGAGVDAVLNLLRTIKAKQKTIVITSHDVDMLAEVASRIIILDEGSIQQEGDVSAILTDGSLLGTYGYKIPEIVRLMRDICETDICKFHTFRSAISLLRESSTGMGSLPKN